MRKRYFFYLGDLLLKIYFLILFKTIIGDFSKENEKFINEKKTQQRREEAALAPWVGYNEEEILKEQIMELSTVIFFFSIPKT